MNRRSFLSFALTALAALPLVGCGGGDESASAEGGKPVIGVSIPAATHGWTAGINYWAEQAQQKYGDVADIRIVTSSTPSEQIGQIESLLTQGVDGLVVLANESAPLTPVAKKVSERGVYLVNVDRGFTEPVADVYVAGDNELFGRRSAEFMVEKLGGEGKIVTITGKPSTVDTARTQAANEVFAQHEGIQVLDSLPGQWDRETAFNAMQTLLQKHPEIDAVWASDDDMAEGIEQAIREANRQNEIWVMPGAGKKTIVKRVMENDPMYPANISYPPAMIHAGIDLAVAKLVENDLAAAADDVPEHLGVTREQLEAAAQQEGQKQILLDVPLITPENASQFYFPESVY